MLGASVALAGQPMALPPFFYLSLFGTVGDFFQAGHTYYGHADYGYTCCDSSHQHPLYSGYHSHQHAPRVTRTNTYCPSLPGGRLPSGRRGRTGFVRVAVRPPMPTTALPVGTARAPAAAALPAAAARL